MNLIAMNGLNALVAALTILLIVINKNARKPIHIAFGIWTIIFFLWTFPYFLWGIIPDRATSLFFHFLLITATCFIHVCFFHFVIFFCGEQKKTTLLKIGYFLSFIFVIIHLNGGLTDPSTAVERGSFRYWPQAAPFLKYLIVLQIMYATYSFWLLLRSSFKNVDPLKTQLRIYVILSLIGWIDGLSNWVYFYTDIPPLGNYLVFIFQVGTAYLIFKYDFLQLQVVVKKTFIYAGLTLLMTLVYTLFIISSEKMFQSYIGYNSFVATVLAALTIAIFFNPIQNALTKFINRLFFGKNIDELSSENIQMRHELQKQDQMRAVATLAAGMAHEIKNPLTTIRTFAEYLPQKYDDPVFRENYKRIVVDEVDRVNNIVKQLLDFSKPKEPSLKPEALNSLIDDTLALLSNNLVKYKINVVKKFTDDALVSADRNQLKQALLNLFLNSIQAMPAGGTMTIESKRFDGKARVTISDTGFGMSPDQLKHVFDPFYTTKEEGTGLGLSIVHGIIERHGGNISFKSETGRGTTAILYLPLIK